MDYDYLDYGDDYAYGGVDVDVDGTDDRLRCEADMPGDEVCQVVLDRNGNCPKAFRHSPI